MNRIPLLLGALFYLIYRLTRYLTGEIWLSLLIFLIPIGFLLVNLALRKKLKYKRWFLSPMNFLLERKKYSTTSDISIDLLFEKLLLVINDSEFQPLDTEKDSYTILCGTSVNFWTWGENIYLELEESSNGATVIHFTSTTLYGNTSWKRNSKNYDLFISEFETSLTI